jgi:cellulose biosynthesis protein BcsQ
MYAALSSKNYWEDIEKAVSLHGGDITYKAIDNDLDVSMELEKLSLLAIKYLFIDLTAISDIDILPQAVMRYRIKNDSTQFIIIAPNFAPGNEVLSQLVSMGVWDILAPTDEQSLEPLILKVLNERNLYKHAVKWYVQGESKTVNTSSVQINKPKYITFKKKIFTVFGCPEFAGEFAFFIANNTDLSVLIIDTDRLTPVLENVLATQSEFNADIKLDIKSKSSFNIALELASKNILNRQAFYNVANKTKSKNLRFLSGNDAIENCEYYTDQPFNTLIDNAYDVFDVVILSTNSYIFDLYTILSLAKSTVNIIPVYADLNSVRSIKNSINYLSMKQNIDTEKHQYIVFDHSQHNLPVNSVKEILEKEIIGHINYSPSRIEARNNIGKCYASHMESSIKSQYIKLLEVYNILPKTKLINKVASFFNKEGNGKGGK